jgi:hypothetical protein
MENDLVLGFCLGSSGLRFWPSAGLRPSAYACRPRAKTSDPSYLGKNLALGRSIADHSSRWTVPGLDLFTTQVGPHEVGGGMVGRPARRAGGGGM